MPLKMMMSSRGAIHQAVVALLLGSLIKSSSSRQDVWLVCYPSQSADAIADAVLRGQSVDYCISR
eukprot:scaffold1468_cov71-Cyclotella_meneghiniana.AAC.10